jgi:hypothetical protein
MTLREENDMSCHNAAVVKAPKEEVWSVLRNFHDMSWASGVIETLDVVGDASADQIGAKRLLNGVFHETLLALDDIDHTFQYQITDGPGPISKDKVQRYIGQVRVFPVTTDDTTYVEWTSRWGANEGGVAEFCDPIYKALLQALTFHFE